MRDLLADAHVDRRVADGEGEAVRARAGALPHVPGRVAVKDTSEQF